MAQVKKFQNGGKTFKINGQTLNTANADDMKRLQDMIGDANHGGFAQFVLDSVNDSDYAGDLDVSLTADGRVNVIGGTQAARDKHLSNRAQKAASNPKKLIKGKDYRNASDSAHSFVKAFGNTTPVESTDGKIRLTGVGDLGGKWTYDENGLWNEADVNNAAMLKRWNDLRDYITGGEENKKRYDVSGLNKDQLDALTEMYKTNPELFNQYNSYFTKDASRLADDSDFYSTFGWYGFNAGTPEEIAAAKAIKDTKKLKEYLTTQGLDFDGAENVFYQDNDGNLMVTDEFLNAFQGDRSGHYWLNDNWANLTDSQGNKNPYSQLKGHIIWNGRVYKDNDDAIINLLNSSGYVDANKTYDAAKAENIMRTQWNDNPTFAHQLYDPKTMYSEWANGINGLRYRALESNLTDGKQLIEYYSDDDVVDNYGYRTPKYAVIGSDGKLVEEVTNPNLYATVKNGQYVPGTASFMVERLGEDAGALAGTYVSGTSVDGKASNTFFYRNPDTGEFFIQDPDLKGKQKGKAVRIPKEIASMVPEEAWEYFRTNKAAKDRLFRLMKDLTNTGFGKKLRQNWTYGIEAMSEDLLKRDFRLAGLSKDDAKAVVDLLNKWGRNSYYKKSTGKTDASAIARQQAFLANPQTDDLVQPFKEGGKIEKHQYGKVLGAQGTTDVKKANIVESDRKDANTNQSWGLGSKDSKQWSELDTWELAGVTADLAALGITIADPTNMGGAFAGAVGSFTNFGADVKRDGFQGKDLGKLGLNLLLDAGTIVPILGDAVQGAKAVRAMKKAAPILSKAIRAGAIVGVSDAAYNTIDKIAKGESFTISDVRRIVNGIQGGVTLSRTGLLNQTKGKKVTTIPDVEIKGNGIKGITLKEAEIKQLQKIKDPAKVKSEIVKLWKSQNPKSKLSESKILEKLDLSDILQTSKRPQLKFWKGLNEVEKINLPSAKGHRPDLTPEQLDAISKKRNGLQNWFWGTGKHQNWLGNVEGDEFLSHYIRTSTGKAKHAPKIPKSDTPNPNYYRLVQHANPKAYFKLNQWTMPNIVSTQQFPEENQFTEDVYVSPQKQFVFKKGGTLKAQGGYKFDFKPTTFAGKTTGWNPSTTLDVDLLNPNYKPIQSTAKRITSQAITGSTPVKGTTYDWKGNNITPTIPTTPASKTTSTPLSTMSFEQKQDGNFDWNYLAKETLGLANTAAAISDAYKFKQQSDKKADLYSLGQPSIWNGRGRMRFQTPTMNLANQQIAANNTIANMLNSSDSGVNLAGKLELAKMNSGVMDQANRQISQEYSNALNQHAATQREDDKLTFETANQAGPYAMNEGLIRNAGETELTDNIGKVRNMYYNKLQSDANRFGLINVSKQDKIDQLNLMKSTPGITADQIKNIDNQIAMINSSEYSDILRRKQMYGTAYAKKGTKLRSTTEQMLLDNNKIVAKAIEKLNDNTTKLILKALS